jgi:hypothetical protein
MADLKISALTASTTPLAGTEVLPIVQSSTTKQVSVANLTAGRDVAMAGATSTDDVKVSAGKGLAWSGNGNTRISPEDNVQGTLIASGGSLKVTVGGGTNAFNIDGTTANATLNTGNLIIGTSGKGIDFSATPGTGTSELLSDYEEGTWTPTQGAGLTVIGAFSSSGSYTKIGRQVTVSGYLSGATSIACTSGGIMCAGLPFSTAGLVYIGSSAAGSATSFNGCGVYGTSVYSVTAVAATSDIQFVVTYFV